MCYPPLEIGLLLLSTPRDPSELQQIHVQGNAYQKLSRLFEKINDLSHFPGTVLSLRPLYPLPLFLFSVNILSGARISAVLFPAPAPISRRTNPAGR